MDSHYLPYSHGQPSLYQLDLLFEIIMISSTLTRGIWGLGGILEKIYIFWVFQSFTVFPVFVFARNNDITVYNSKMYRGFT